MLDNPGAYPWIILARKNCHHLLFRHSAASSLDSEMSRCWKIAHFCKRVLRVYQLVSAQDFEHAKGYCVWMLNGIKYTAVIPNRLGGTDLRFLMREQELCRFCTNDYPSVLKFFLCRWIDTQCTSPQCMAWALLLLSSIQALSSSFILGFTLELWGRFCESDSRLIWNWNMTKSRIFSHTVTA